MLMENNGPKLVCRKCQGSHLTIKCGKENKSVIESKILEYNNHIDEKRGKGGKSSFYDNSESNFKDGDNKSGFRDNPESNFRGRDNKSGKGSKGGKGGFYDNSESDVKHERRPLHKVKISNLPFDMSEEELNELLYEWGHVVRLRLLNYESNSTAYIEFKDKEAADYIVKALDKTPFEHIMLDVERLYD